MAEGEIKTLCEIGVCSVCGKQYAKLKSGLIVAANCEHAWRLGDKAETVTIACEICRQPIIMDPSGQVVYMHMCKCLRGPSGFFESQNVGLNAINLQCIGMEFAYIRSQNRQALDLAFAHNDVLIALVNTVNALVDQVAGLKAERKEPAAAPDAPEDWTLGAGRPADVDEKKVDEGAAVDVTPEPESRGPSAEAAAKPDDVQQEMMAKLKAAQAEKKKDKDAKKKDGGSDGRKQPKD